MLSKKKINDNFFLVFSKQEIAAMPKLLNVNKSSVSNWRSGREQVPWKNLAYAVEKKGVTWDYLLEGKENASPPPPRVDGEFNIEPIDIVFSLQKSLADFQVILAESGRDLAVGQSLKGYNDIPGLLTTVRKLKDLCESVSKRLESYPQHEKDHGHSDQDRTA